MIVYDRKCVILLKDILYRINYKIIFKNLVTNYNRYLENNFKLLNSYIENSDIKNKDIIKFWSMGIYLNKDKLLEYITVYEYDSLIKNNIIINKNNNIRTNNIIVFIYEDLFILTELNPYSSNCINKSTDIYIGPDSLELAKNIEFKKNASILDLCSGTGIQGILTAKFAKKVICVELNDKAIEIIKYNVSLNDLDAVVKVIKSNLYENISSEKFDYIYVNPPFLPIPKNIDFPICGHGGEDGLKIINKILFNLNDFLDDNGKLIMFCQCIGDENGQILDDNLKQLSLKYKFDIKVLITKKILWEYYINLFSDYINKFLSQDKERIKQEFLKLKFNTEKSYLYTTIYKLTKTKKSKFQKIELQNRWNITQKVNIYSDVKYSRNANNIYLNKSGLLIPINEEILDILQLLKKGFTIQVVANKLFNKYKINYKYGVESFKQRILDLCKDLDRMDCIYSEYEGKNV